jgi:uncharacterized protein involved in outer membrane biogenesis
MKKIIVRILVVVVVLLVAAFIVVGMFLDSIVKKGVETAGPAITKVDVRLDGVSLSIFSGKGTIKGLFVGNPEGYKTASAIQVGEATVQVKPGSLMSDKIVVESVSIMAPDITIEGGLKENNLTKIMENVQSFSGSTTTNAPQGGTQKPAQKIQVNDLLITGGKVNVSLSLLGGKTMTVPLPEIHLTDLGKDSDGITPAELAQTVMKNIVDGALSGASKAVSSIGSGAADAAKSVGEGAKEGAGKVTKSIGNLFKK